MNFSLALIVFAEWRNRARGVSYKWAMVILVLLFFQMSPWLSPMKSVAQLSEPATHLLHGALVTIGFLVPGLLLTWLINRTERLSAGAMLMNRIPRARKEAPLLTGE